MPFGRKEKDTQEKSNEQQKVTASQAEFDSYMMTAENSPHPKPSDKSSAPPSSSFGVDISKFSLTLGGKSADSKPKPAEIKTASQQEYEQYEMTAENSPYKPPPASTASKFTSAIGSTLSKFSQKSSHPKVDLHVDASSSNAKSKSEEEYEQFASTAENSPDKKVQPKPKATVASRMKSISEFTSSIGKNISDILDLPEPTTNNSKSSSGNSNGSGVNNSKDNKPSEPDIFSSSVIDVVRSLGNDLKQGAKQMLPSKGTSSSSSGGSSNNSNSTSTAASSSAANVNNDKDNGKRSSSTGRRQKPPPPKDNTRIFDYLEMSRDDEEYDPRGYQPSRPSEVAPTAGRPPVKPSKDSKTSALFTPVKGSSSIAVGYAAVSHPTPSSELTSASSATSSSASASAASDNVTLTPLSSAAPADSSFDYLAHNISLNTDITPLRSPLVSNNDSNSGEDRMESLLRSIYEAEQQQHVVDQAGNDDNEEEREERLRASSSEEDTLESNEHRKKRQQQHSVGSLLDTEDAAEYDDDYCV